MVYGDLGKRIVAYLIDGVILSAISAVLVWMALLLFMLPLLIFIPFLALLYFVMMEGGSWHATLGKRLMNLYVADANGNGITYSTAVLRYLGKIISTLLLFVGYLMCFFSERKQCLHDMIAKTYVLEGAVEESGSFRVPRLTGTGSRRYPQLVGISGPLAGRIYEVDERGLLMGRDSVSCQVVVPSSQGKVSRTHCFLTYNPISDMFVLSDRNSTHGTYLTNGKRVSYSQPIALKSGQRFCLANSDNTFEVR